MKGEEKLTGNIQNSYNMVTLIFQSYRIKAINLTLKFKLKILNLADTYLKMLHNYLYKKQ